MSFYPETWIEAAADPHGPGLRLHFLVRRPDGTLLELTNHETVLSLNPIAREAERGVGVMQGQAWEIELTRTGGVVLPPGGMDGCWCQVRGSIDAESAPLATGRIRGYRASSDGIMRFSVEDPLVELVNARFSRAWGWFSNGYAGLIHAIDASGSYRNEWDHEGDLVGVQHYPGNEFRLRDTSYTITFLNGEQFEVSDDAGGYTTTGSITTDKHVASGYDPTHFVATIKAAGWNDEAGAYTAGDKFTFATSAPRSGFQRSPVSLLEDLIERCAGLVVVDVPTGEVFSTPRHDVQFGSGAWYEAYLATLTQHWSGQFERGDDVVDAIQGILRVLNWALFCAPDGRIVLHRPVPGGEPRVHLRGDWASGSVNVTSSERSETMEWVANVVRFTATGPSGDPISAESVDLTSPYPAGLLKEFEIPWIVPFGVLRAAASQTLARLKRARELFSARTLLPGAALLPGEMFMLHDPDGEANNETLTASRVRVDPMNESAEVVGFRDALTGEGFFIVGGPDTVPVGSRIGGEGDPGAARLW